MPVELPNVDIGAPGGAVGKVLVGLSSVWSVLKWVLLFLAIVLVLVVFVVWIIGKFRKKPSVVGSIISDMEKSAEQTKRSEVKDVYLCSDTGMNWIGSYCGEFKKNNVYYVLIKKKKTFPLLKCFHDIIYNFFIKIFFLVCTTEKSIKQFDIDGKEVLLIFGSSLSYDGATKYFVVEGHGALPSVVMDAVLKNAEKEYLYEFVKKTGEVMSTAFEINPFLKGRLKLAQEKEEKETEDEEEEK